MCVCVGHLSLETGGNAVRADMLVQIASCKAYALQLKALLYEVLLFHFFLLILWCTFTIAVAANCEKGDPTHPHNA